MAMEWGMTAVHVAMQKGMATVAMEQGMGIQMAGWLMGLASSLQ
jgi:hypothetical protein